MSSLARRIQTRIFARKGVQKVAVLSETTGNVKAWNWPRRVGQLAITVSGLPLFADTKHETLQPIIDILADNARRSTAAA